ncbi:MAG: hypothetical protein GF410_00850 [Chitinivibrionales bacterium]|nr:hypothetical protein [Chitinivibrionales bacterium]
MQHITQLFTGALVVLVGFIARPMLAQELLFFDMDKVVLKDGQDMGCFPKGNTAPAENNGNWKSPVDFTTGRVYVRVEIRSMPTNFCLQPSFAIWTDNGHELVTPFEGRPIVNATTNPEEVTVETVSFDFSSWFYYHGGVPADWEQPRSKMGPVIKSCDGKFIHVNDNWGQGQWGGYDPDDVYPIDMRMSLVVVANGATFSGWEHHLGLDAPEDNPTAVAQPFRRVAAARKSQSLAVVDPLGRLVPAPALQQRIGRAAGVCFLICGQRKARRACMFNR